MNLKKVFICIRTKDWSTYKANICLAMKAGFNNQFLANFEVEHGARIPKKNYDYAVLWGYKRELKYDPWRVEIVNSVSPQNLIVIEVGSFIYKNKNHYSKFPGLGNLLPDENWYSVGRGDFKYGGIKFGRTDYRNENSPPDRLEKLGLEFNTVNWKDNNKIMICGQIINDATIDDLDFNLWLHDTYTTLRKNTKKEIYFKPHPMQNISKYVIPEGCKVIENNYIFKDIIDQYYAVVTLNSNSGVESLLEGVPAIATNKRSMIYKQSATYDLAEIDNIKIISEEDKLQWAYDMSYSHWTLDEMKQGLPHRQLGLLEKFK